MSAGTTTVACVVEHRLFEVDEARALLPEMRRRVDALVEARADLTELSVDLRRSGSSPLGGLAEVKALQARLDDMLEWFPGQGIEVKGVAPVLLDFPAELNGMSVRLCWLEGEPALAWYHRSDLGIAGRRRLPD
ncbi:MAG: DUF2203 domain-containing protein [Pseudonocardiales bacterium]|nr:DUF2203 domain-containing protein [Pseudonocardiales bacterium]MBV9032383.1 DUF2203 domain-containing protein [Pseudonocardiales bacterium]MBW0008793.1 DUF2203 domain-containing protein [Pseudonocardiales bacterium]